MGLDRSPVLRSLPRLKKRRLDAARKNPGKRLKALGKKKMETAKVAMPQGKATTPQGKTAA
jgi:hypothetical protein